MTGSPPVMPEIERTTLKQAVYDELKQALLAGLIEPGMTLTLRQLATQFGTSMMPVREAVARFSAEGVLVVQPNRGVTVSPLPDAEADDIWMLRVSLEGDAAMRAAERVTPHGLFHIENLCDAVRVAGERGVLHRFLEANNAFQFAVYQTARSQTLLQFIEVLRMRSVPYSAFAIRKLLRDESGFLDKTLRYHDELIDALRQGDGAAARRIKRADLRSFRQYLLASDDDSALSRSASRSVSTAHCAEPI